MERKGSTKIGHYRTIMQSLRRKLSFRKKKDHVPECSKPHQWQEDEKKVREGTCSFQVRYLGYIEVFDSRGMHICEEAVKALKSQCKGKYQRAVLYVSGDALRVVDEISKSMIVDQTIEKVSFCAPDRNHEKGFAYICRDGTTRRWMCHGFLATKESGERLSHAVGCAFAICLEKKQKRDKETGVSVTYNQSRTCFERTGSFRQTTLTERIVDPQSAILAEPVPVRSASNPYAVQRPHATANLLERQGSFRGFEKLQEISPFKRTLSLRLNEQPFTLQRQNAVAESSTLNGSCGVGGTIPELSQEQEDSIAQMCQQLTQGLTALTSDDPFSGVPNLGSTRGHTLIHQTSLPTPHHNHAVLTRQYTLPASQTLQLPSQHVANPWGSTATSQFAHTTWVTATTHATVTTASSTGSYNPFATAVPSYPQPAMLNGLQQTFPQPSHRVASQQHLQQQPQQTFAHSRSPFTDTGAVVDIQWQQQNNQLRKTDATQNGAVASTPSTVANSLNPWPTSGPPVPSTSAQGPGVDPFDVAWAAKSINKSNPSSFGANKSVKQFEIQL